MSHEVKVNARVCIENNCTMRYHSSDEDVYFILGCPQDEFEIAFTTHSLTCFVRLAQHALQHATSDEHGPVTLADLVR